jgi:hypothetical protein
VVERKQSKPPVNEAIFHYWWFRYAARTRARLLNHRDNQKELK